MTIDWEREIESTSESARDALLETLAEADDIEHLLIIASYKDQPSNADLDGKMLTRSNTKATYIKLGLIDFARSLHRGFVGEE